MVTFKSLDKVNRTVVFDVNGVDVVRGVPSVFEGTIADYIDALKSGLEIEFAPKVVRVIETPSLKSGDVIVSAPADAVLVADPVV